MTDDERIAAIEARLADHLNMVRMGYLMPDAPHPDAIVHLRFYSTADAMEDVPYLLARLREAEQALDITRADRDIWYERAVAEEAERDAARADAERWRDIAKRLAEAIRFRSGASSQLKRIIAQEDRKRDALAVYDGAAT